jgi:hypothetical protein
MNYVAALPLYGSMLLLLLTPVISFAQGITLMAPLCGSDTIAFEPGLGMLFSYFNCGISWLYNIGIGACVLWTLIGGVHIIVSGDNSELYSKGKNYMIGSITGLLLLIFAPVFLRFINSSFFV